MRGTRAKTLRKAALAIGAANGVPNETYLEKIRDDDFFFSGTRMVRQNCQRGLYRYAKKITRPLVNFSMTQLTQLTMGLIVFSNKQAKK